MRKAGADPLGNEASDDLSKKKRLDEMLAWAIRKQPE
jgi:hypothetical protein